MIALLARLVAIVPVLLHGVFGCCWHHAHVHAHASACCTPSERVAEGDRSEHEHCHATDAGDPHHHMQAMCVHKVESSGQTSLAHGDSESTEDDRGEDGCNEDRCALSLWAMPFGLRGETSSEVDYREVLSPLGSVWIVCRANRSGLTVSLDRPIGRACLHRAHLQVWRI